MIYKPTIALAFCAVLVTTACQSESQNAQINDQCEFAMVEFLTETVSSEATEFFEIAKSLDIAVIKDAPETIRPDLRTRDYDRSKARMNYQKAADLGHVNAMNALAFLKLEGLGRADETYEEEPKEAFALYSKIAQHGHARGFQAMSAMLMEGFPDQPSDPKLATACMVRAAQLADPTYLDPAFFLAEYDLGIYPTLINNPLDDGPRMERGLTLLDDLLLKGYAPSYGALALFYQRKDVRPDPREYFLRIGATAGAHSAISVDAFYRVSDFGREDPMMSECLGNLTFQQSRDIETLCPRPDGPLTREQVGLPPAPTQPLDVKAYLTEFAQRHPDL